MATTIKRLLSGAIALAVVGAVYVAATRDTVQKQAGGGRRGGAPAGLDLPVPIVAGVAEARDVPVFLEGVGTARALNTVVVRPQVDGKIVRVVFKEGQSVKKGDLLAEIDPTTYQAALDQAKARYALTETQLANAQRDLQRYQKIPGVVAQKTVDTQTAQVSQLQAQLKSDAAAVVSATAVLDYTRILAPIDGRTGLRQVDEGNIVRAAGDASIVTITQVQPISIMFTLPQQSLPVVSRASAAAALLAEAMDADNRTVLDRGTLKVIDNQVDQTTGTVRMRAEFPNADLQLWPGQFVNVRLLVDTLKQAVVVPTQAVQRGPTGPFVFVISSEERARLTPVTLAQQGDTETVVKAGVSVGDRLVVSGFARLQDGSRVVPGRGSEDAPGARPPGAGGQGSGAPSAQRPGQGPGEGGGRSRFEAIREACGADIATHCAVPRDQIRACLEQNKAKFSPTCQAALTASGGGRGEGKQDGGRDGRDRSDERRGERPRAALQ